MTLSEDQCLLGRHRTHLSKQGNNIFANRMPDFIRSAVNWEGRRRGRVTWKRMMHRDPEQSTWDDVTGRDDKINKWGLIRVTSSTCRLARKCLQGTVMEKSSQHFLGTQDAGVPILSA